MNTVRKFFHGTTNAERILKEGFDMDADRASDPGDFGWGIYLTPNRERARGHGPVLEVIVDTEGFAKIPNPYFLVKGENIRPKTPEELLFYNLVFCGDCTTMLTVRGIFQRRVMLCKLVREEFLLCNYTGILTEHDEAETVVFDPSTIISIKKASL